MVADGPGMQPPRAAAIQSVSASAAAVYLAAALRGENVVTLGGGTGPYALLSRLKRLPCSVTAIVSMADSGGSSRRLIDEFGQLPVGDLRQALVALSTSSQLWRELFSFRFGSRSRHRPPREDAVTTTRAAATLTPGLSGHNLGNLIITALQDLHGDDLLRALDAAKRLLRVVGDVVPVTLLPTTLCAELADGTVLRGETAIDTRGQHQATAGGELTPIQHVWLDPPVPACPRALDALRRADLIVIGPGDLYTSILPTLLVDGVAPAIAASRARKIYVCNLTTKHGETDGFHASDFVREIQCYLGGTSALDRVILHNGVFPDHLRHLYVAHGQDPVTLDDAELQAVKRLVHEVIVDDLLAMHAGHFARHDAARLVRAILASADT